MLIPLSGLPRRAAFSLSVVSVLSLSLWAVGCNPFAKADDTSASGTDGGAPTTPLGVTPGALPPGARGEEEGVFRYNGETLDTGTTHMTTRSLTIRKGADYTSDIVGSVGPGTGVNLRAHYGAFSLVEFPAGPGLLKKGWFESNGLSGGALPVATVVTTTTTTATATVAPTVVTPTATATTTTTATARPVIRLPPKK